MCSPRAASGYTANGGVTGSRSGITSSCRATTAPRGRTPSSRRCRWARRASLPAAAPTSTSARRRSRPAATRPGVRLRRAHPDGGAPQRVFVTRTNDCGRRPGAAGGPVRARRERDRPAARSSGAGGDVRIWYMQTSGGDNPNAVERLVPPLARTADELVGAGQARRRAAGRCRLRPRARVRRDLRRLRRDGDDQRGQTIAAWGEGFSYNGPGGTWFNLQR